MRNKFALSVICASMVMLTGCEEEQVVFKTDPAILGQLKELNAQNSSLTVANQQLTKRNAELTATIEDLQNKPQTKPTNFVEQCKTAGISFEYVDPNLPFTSSAPAQQFAATQECSTCHTATQNPPPHADFGNCANCHNGHSDDTPPPSGGPTDPSFEQPEFGVGGGSIDGKTGASGKTYYTPGSYLNAQYLKQQLDAQYHIYRWKAVETGGVTTIENACNLANRQHMVDMFPNDGKAYEIEYKKNALGAKLIATVNNFDLDGKSAQSPNIATFGYGLQQIDGDYFVSMSIGKSNTCYNVIMNGEARLSYYEYDPAELEKTGLQTASRNRGARIIVKTDYVKTGLQGLDWQTAIPGLGQGENFAPTDVDWSQVGACKLMLKVENIIPLG